MMMHRPQTPQPGFGSVTLLQQFTPYFKILDPRLKIMQCLFTHVLQSCSLFNLSVSRAFAVVFSSLALWLQQVFHRSCCASEVIYTGAYITRRSLEFLVYTVKLPSKS